MDSEQKQNSKQTQRETEKEIKECMMGRMPQSRRLQAQVTLLWSPVWNLEAFGGPESYWRALPPGVKPYQPFWSKHWLTSQTLQHLKFPSIYLRNRTSETKSLFPFLFLKLTSSDGIEIGGKGGRIQALKEWHSPWGYYKSWFKPMRSKMAEDLASTGLWASL